ncbi:hypothetical protein [Novosphingobium sp.]|uniref:hypothetical protein n=1 Tax=Novosphingobium sp. TaxID=1874826 RepID=UPI002735AD25|nr:hypothetical protein [Novosphingobium sp.]MDP3907133.1 hypothetical protein [Novosphingobium sp.]
MPIPSQWPLLIGLVIGVAAMLIGLGSGVLPTDGWELAARWTARVGFPIFLLVYLASSLARLWPGGWRAAVLRDRRFWGLGFAACHTVHLFALVMFLKLGDETRGLETLIPGGLGYVVLYAMAATSTDGAMRKLGANWKRLHRVGIHYLWLIFTLSYAGRLMTAETRIVGVIGTALALAALGLRLAARRPAKA